MKLTLRHALALLSSMLLWSMAGHAQVRIDMDHDWRFRTDATDAGIAEIDHMLSAKEKEILTV